MVPAQPKEESEETVSTLEEPRTEAGWDPNKAGVASKGSTGRVKMFGSNMHGIFPAE
jgi:hypothetical protein